MKIKGIEIFGFKSFFDKTTAELSSRHYRYGRPPMGAVRGNYCGRDSVVFRRAERQAPARRVNGRTLFLMEAGAKKPWEWLKFRLTPLPTTTAMPPYNTATTRKFRLHDGFFAQGESEYFINKDALSFERHY